MHNSTVYKTKDIVLFYNAELPTSRLSLPSPLFISLRLCQDLDYRHPSVRRYSPVLSQTYRRSAEGQKGQVATDSLNDHSILPGAKVMEMGASRTRQALWCRASSHLSKKKKAFSQKVIEMVMRHSSVYTSICASLLPTVVLWHYQTKVSRLAPGVMNGDWLQARRLIR